jgi:hypothetical protein
MPGLGIGIGLRRRRRGVSAPVGPVVPSITAMTSTATGPTTASLDVTASPVDGTLYWFVSASATPPVSATLKAGTGAASSGSFVITAVPGAHAGPAGLSASTAYYTHAIYTASGVDSVIATTTFTTAAADVTAPVLSLPTAAIANETSAAAGVTTNEGNGTLYWVATTSATQPTAAQIRAGQNNGGAAAVQFGAQAVSATGAQSIFGGIISLTAGTTYYAHFLHDDTSGNASNLVATSGFVPADVTAPLLSSLEATTTGSSTASVTVNTDTAAGTLYWITVAAGAAASTAAAVQAGSSQAVTASGPQAFSLTGLAATTAYVVRAVHKDAANNVSAIVESPTFTTASATVFFNYFDTGLATIPSSQNAVGTGAYADSDGGTNATLFEGDGLGGAGLENVRAGPSIVFNVGMNVINLRIKAVNHVASKLWMRLRPENVSFTTSRYVDITNDSTLDADRIDTPGTGTVTNLGGGWMQVTLNIDMTGAADVNGIFAMYLSTSSGSGSIINDTVGANSVAFHKMTVATA